ncbi:hypothetical protein [Streptomyces sp. CA-253872]|uniref:hypothetical protein n=1 Tax=Streptomyces sp. CA-253872 TaxID=3240067 RepID=UPI003D8FA17A
MTWQGAVAVRGTGGTPAAGSRDTAVFGAAGSRDTAVFGDSPGSRDAAARAARAVFRDAYSGFAKEGGRVGSGALGAGTGGVARCV